ncbi:MAG: GMP synthase (glutamine-hydrolyzing) [Planctomycetota bacterium]|jgi:GMP synthase (glutamine-hydrolysing)
MSDAPKFVVIDCYLDDIGGARNVVPHFPGARVIRAARETIPDQVDADGVIITGSAASVLESRPWIDALEQSVRRTAEQGTAILGLCFGHQLLARALFGEGAVRRAVIPEFGWGQLELLGEEVLFDKVPARFKCFLSHKDEIDPSCSAFQKGVRILSRSEDCPVEAFAVLERQCWGVQFHSEMDLTESRNLIESRLGAESSDAVRLLQDAIETTELAKQLFANFSSQVANGM